MAVHLWVRSQYPATEKSYGDAGCGEWSVLDGSIPLKALSGFDSFLRKRVAIILATCFHDLLRYKDLRSYLRLLVPYLIGWFDFLGASESMACEVQGSCNSTRMSLHDHPHIARCLAWDWT